MSGSSSQHKPARPGLRNRLAVSRRLETVFVVSVGITIGFVLAGVLFTDPFTSALSSVVDVTIGTFGWFYLLAATAVLAFVVFLACSRYGRMRLGRPGQEPEFGRLSWFAMLFQAGMGIGLLFWATSEPLLHYRAPPLGQAEPGSPEAFGLALQYAFFHWTLHPWAIYAAVGLAVAYISYRREATDLRISTVYRPLLGDRVDGPIGKAIDVFAVMATLFGISVSLGLGTLQIDAGLSETFGTPTGLGAQLVIIVVAGAAYMLSASTPVEHGIRWLSNSSMILAVALLLIFVVLGPTVMELNALTQGIGSYVTQAIPMGLNTTAFEPDPWLGEWTIFFWATWIAWAPYVGVFIARISRGRTIREFVIGVLVAPSLFSMIWFAVFGTAAINLDDSLGGAISEIATQDEALGLFAFLAESPLATITSVLTIVLVWIFFVAGADSGTIVLGSMSSDGSPNPSRRLRLTWGVLLGAVGAVLLAAGGLDALQNAVILAALPFTVLLLAICWSLYRALATDRDERRSPDHTPDGDAGSHHADTDPAQPDAPRT